MFGPDEVNIFCRIFKIDVIIRAHEVYIIKFITPLVLSYMILYFHLLDNDERFSLRMRQPFNDSIQCNELCKSLFEFGWYH